jgi:hypothetical protein
MHGDWSPVRCALLWWLIKALRGEASAARIVARGADPVPRLVLRQAGGGRRRSLPLIWDNAGWHISRAVRDWVRRHNRRVKQERRGVRLVICCLPTKSPWLNPIEPKWADGRRRSIEVDRLLTAEELAERVCAVFGYAHEPHLTMLNDVT